jgi:hypothetical protein
MTLDDAIKRMDEVRDFLEDCEYRGRAEDLEALAIVMECVRGKADPRQATLPLPETPAEAHP